MGKKKALVGEERKAALKLLKHKMAWLKEKTIPEKTFYILALYKKTFSKSIDPENYEHGFKKVMQCLFHLDRLFHLEPKHVSAIYLKELKFIKELSTKGKAPASFTRSLAVNYIDNLNGRSRVHMPGASKAFKEHEVKDLNKEMEAIYSSTTAASPIEELSKAIPSTALEHFLREPFYDIDLKFLLLRSEDPKGRKGLQSIIYDGFEVSPYKMTKKYSLLSLIEQYIILADQLDLASDIDWLEKSSLPVRDERIYDLIWELRNSKGNKDIIHGELRSILALP